ncbi:TetR/AcrR family transcriptional regulator [Oceanobacillus sp. M60]|uniref:TetR/AcrR family transcriptional regulator n=1 Tax=Oceanobacillus oncorhynchi TaxID=545501 RepID=UPI00211673AC|nr:TetR/AcrR family transcriptional regulator [Oceanobacillus oncorhynchi]UUI41728.1 TetR/AcrR family transcriptional regulator [Oceanobacillus oncorhynchi]
MARGFSQEEKEKIKANLYMECEKSWVSNGYRKTNIDQLCSKVGISKGAFYLFFDSKEDLFADVMDKVQDRMITHMNKAIAKFPDKKGFIEGFKLLYQEYDQGNWIRTLSGDDFQSLLNRLPEDRLMIHNAQYTMDKLGEIIEKNNLICKEPLPKIIGILSTLLAISAQKEAIAYDEEEVLDFLLEHIIDGLFE